MDEKEKEKIVRDFVQFKKAVNNIATVTRNGDKYNNTHWLETKNHNAFNTREKISKILEDNVEDELRAMSNHFFTTSGIYKRMLLYLSGLLTYDIMTIPKKTYGDKFSKKMIQKLFESCYFLDRINLEGQLPQIMLSILVDGVFYGFYKYQDGRSNIQQLPARYCRSRYYSFNNNALLELSVHYFDSFIPKDKTSDVNYFPVILETYPKYIVNAYKEYRKGNTSKLIDGHYIMVNEGDGLAFYYYDKKPLFVSTILAIKQLEDYKGLDEALDKQELKKILYQQIPMNKDTGDLLMSTDEAEAVHTAATDMLRNNPDIDVFTGFCDAKLLETSNNKQSNRDNLEKMERSVYNEAGITKNLFATDTNLALEYSLNNDFELIYNIACNTFVPFINFIVNREFSDGKKYFFEVSILPITHYNREKMSNLYLQGAQYGFSKIMAGIAFGVKQSNLMNQIELENDVLKLAEIMVPLQSSYTTSGKDVEKEETKSAGAPSKEDTQKSPKTIKNIEAK